EPIARELHVLDRILQETVRQVGLHCWERGKLLQKVRARYWSIIEEALGISSILKRDMMSLRKDLRDRITQSVQHAKDKEILTRRLIEETQTTAGLRDELGKMAHEVEAMERRLRRGRFDIIEEELAKYKFKMDKQMVDFSDRTRRALHQEFEEKLRKRQQAASSGDSHSGEEST
ncbi:unnamed protein product, partial [Ostreobium quekettii]